MTTPRQRPCIRHTPTTSNHQSHPYNAQSLAAPADLQVEHDLDQFLAVLRRKLAPLVEDGLQFGGRYLVEVKFDKTVPEGPREHLAPAVQARGILGSE